MSTHVQEQARAAATTPRSVNAGATGLLQRKCACGGVAGPSGECEACRRKQLALQTKLRVNEPGDVYEQEADRVADRVMRAPAQAAVHGAPLRIQRLPAGPGGPVGAVPRSVDRALASPGRPLEPAVRQDMEQRFGHDFSTVRVHTGAAAEQSAREVNAQAYTVGNDIVFDAGRFAPWMLDGQRLLAHELTHVVQQTGAGAAPTVQRDVDPRSRTAQRSSGEIGFIADPRRNTDIAFAREQAEADVMLVRQNGLTERLRRSMRRKLAFFSGKAQETYKEIIRPAVVPGDEIEMPADVLAPQSYAYVGDPANKESERFARERGRDLGERIRVTGRPSAEQRLEFEGMGRFFTGNARQVYEQEVNEFLEKRDPRISQFVRDSIEEVDGSGRERVLVAIVLNVQNYDRKRGLRQWALELKAAAHGRKGNYLLAFLEELGGRHVFDEEQRDDPSVGTRVAKEVIRRLAEHGVAVLELYVERALSELSAHEQGKYATVDIAKYHIYDWKRAGGSLLEPVVEAINVIIHFVPVVGQVLGGLEGLLGQEILTGRKLAGWERLLGVLPYAGKILGAGKAGVSAILIIARESKMKPDAIYRLLKGARGLAADADQLREIKRLVDTYQTISPTQRNLLRSAVRTFKPIEEEARAASVLAKADDPLSAKAAAQADQSGAGKAIAPIAAHGAKAHPPGTVLAESPVSGGHAIKATPEGIKVCSPPPCDFIRNAYKGEISAHQEERLRLADANRTANPKWAANVAAEVREELEAERLLAREARAGGRARRTVTQYQRDLAQRGLLANSRFARIVQRVFARKIEKVLPRTSRVDFVAVEGSEAGIAQGRAAARPGTHVNPEIEARIDLPDAVRKQANLHVPERGASRIKGSFKPDDIEFLGGDLYRFKDHKEVTSLWKDSFYNTDVARPKIQALLQRDADIARALGPNCKGFAFTTNSPELAKLITAEINKFPIEVRKYLHAP